MGEERKGLCFMGEGRRGLCFMREGRRGLCFMGEKRIVLHGRGKDCASWDQIPISSSTFYAPIPISPTLPPPPPPPPPPSSQIWDVPTGKLLRTLETHESRVSSLSWEPHSTLLSTGSQSGSIHHHDIRDPQPVATHELNAHGLEVCGLRWSPTGRLLASGGNDNIVNVWDPFSTATGWRAPSHTFTQHTAAVKALAWCPWQHNILATGGGTADQHIRAWNVFTGGVEASVDTGSQVSAPFSHLSCQPNPVSLLSLSNVFFVILPYTCFGPFLSFSNLFLPMFLIAPPALCVYRSVVSSGPQPTMSCCQHMASRTTWWPSGATLLWARWDAC